MARDEDKVAIMCVTLPQLIIILQNGWDMRHFHVDPNEKDPIHFYTWPAFLSKLCGVTDQNTTRLSVGVISEKAKTLFRLNQDGMAPHLTEQYPNTPLDKDKISQQKLLIMFYFHREISRLVNDFITEFEGKSIESLCTTYIHEHTTLI